MADLKSSTLKSVLDQESQTSSKTGQNSPNIWKICRALVIIPLVVIITFSLCEATSLGSSPTLSTIPTEEQQQIPPKVLVEDKVGTIRLNTEVLKSVKTRKRAANLANAPTPGSTTTTSPTSTSSTTSTTSSSEASSTTTPDVASSTTSTTEQAYTSSRLEITITKTLPNGSPTYITSTTYVAASVPAATASSKAGLQSDSLSWQPNRSLFVICCVLASAFLMF